jgi:serine-type D-Ala-D-Ala carboxypeptidase/endopeptidase
MNRRTFLQNACAGLLAQLALCRIEAQATVPAQGARVALTDDAIRAILRRRIDAERRATGMAVGIVEGQRQRVIVYGRQATGDARRVRGDTLFEIGSLTKVFTALLLADMVQRDEVRFDDPVDRYLPHGLRTPQHAGRAITLADLATHTAGLPLFPPLTGHPLRAIARYAVSDLAAWLAGLTLARAPGAQWEYSNVGYCLLGLALANRAGVSYEALLNRRIIGPLKLRDTTLHPAGAATRRLAVGHDPQLAPVLPLDLGIFAPAGALRSTLNDLLIFARAMLAETRSEIEGPVRVLLSVRRPAPALGGEQALGWDVVTGTDPYVVKDGVTAGQAATIVLEASRRIAVVVLSNALPARLKAPPDGGVGAADLARHLTRPSLPLG